MDIKKTAIETAKSAKFEGADIKLDVVNSRLQVGVNLRASVDLPGDLDQVVANIAGMLGVGNSKESSPPPAP